MIEVKTVVEWPEPKWIEERGAVLVTHPIPAVYTAYRGETWGIESLTDGQKYIPPEVRAFAERVFEENKPSGVWPEPVLAECKGHRTIVIKHPEESGLVTVYSGEWKVDSLRYSMPEYIPEEIREAAEKLWAENKPSPAWGFAWHEKTGAVEIVRGDREVSVRQFYLGEWRKEHGIIPPEVRKAIEELWLEKTEEKPVDWRSKFEALEAAVQKLIAGDKKESSCEMCHDTGFYLGTRTDCSNCRQRRNRRADIRRELGEP